MKTPSTVASVNRRTALLALAGSALQLTGCSGGVDVAGLSSGGTGSFTSGPIVGLGSIIVNGIRYDIDRARIIGESSSPAALKLGMVVNIQGSSTQASGTPGTPLKATAGTIRYGSEWRGPLGNVDTLNGHFMLLGQTVDVLASTIFDGVTDLGSLAALSDPTLVEVYGYLDPSTGRLQATRVELKTALSDYRLSGMVTQKYAGSFTLGQATITYSAGTPQPASWDVDALVHVRMDRSMNALEITTPVQQVLGEFKLDDDEAGIEGIVTAYSTGNTSFAVNGIEIDGSALKNMESLGLAIGVRVEVEGRIARGRILASEIEVKGSSAELKDAETEYEFHGTLSQLDTLNHRFMLRGYTIGYEPTTLGGLVLSNGLNIEVKAVLSGNKLLAVEIGLED